MSKKITSSQPALSFPETTPVAPTVPDPKAPVMPANSTVKEDEHAWIQKHWIEITIPAWRRILQESIQEKNPRRENYARWMLGEVLKDPEYRGLWLPPKKFEVEIKKVEDELVDGEVPEMPQEEAL